MDRGSEKREERKHETDVNILSTETTLFLPLFVLQSRSPRWPSGYPRILLALVLEFDSHRGEI